MTQNTNFFDIKQFCKIDSIIRKFLTAIFYLISLTPFICLSFHSLKKDSTKLDNSLITPSMSLKIVRSVPFESKRVFPCPEKPTALISPTQFFIVMTEGSLCGFSWDIGDRRRDSKWVLLTCS